MYTHLYNRLCGWLYVVLALTGLTAGHVGDYIHVSQAESVLYLCVGIFAMTAARFRHRDATLVAVVLGLGLFGWGIVGLAWPTNGLGTSDPLESALHLVAGAWGMYAAVTDTLAWRQRWLRSS